MTHTHVEPTGTITRDSVLKALQRHIGKENGIPATKLVQEISHETVCEAAGTRLLRSVVSQLRDEGIAICAHPTIGYFIAQTSEELNMCCDFLRQRAMHSLKLESRLRKIPMQDLLGQLRVPT